jgi:hypothetical protein
MGGGGGLGGVVVVTSRILDEPDGVENWHAAGRRSGKQCIKQINRVEQMKYGTSGQRGHAQFDSTWSLDREKDPPPAQGGNPPVGRCIGPIPIVC